MEGTNTVLRILDDGSVMAIVVPQKWEVSKARYPSRECQRLLDDKWEPAGMYTQGLIQMMVFKRPVGDL